MSRDKKRPARISGGSAGNQLRNFQKRNDAKTYVGGNMNHDFTGKIPAKVRQALRRRGRKDWHYNEQTGHYMARYDAYKSAKAAAMAAIENGYRPDIERLEDIRMGWAAFRFNGNAPARYCEVEELARGAFRVWIFPAIALEEQR